MLYIILKKKYLKHLYKDLYFSITKILYFVTAKYHEYLKIINNITMKEC